MFKDICGGGGKGGGSSYDPQIGRAAASAARVADRAQAFSEQYYNDVITPLIRQQSASSTESQERLGRMYDINAEQMEMSVDRYRQYGIPAEERYFRMVDEYSAPEEQERQAMAAKGDLGQAMENMRGQQQRQQQALGIDPTSGAAQSVAGNQAIMGAAMEAAAMNRARGTARQLGMQLTSDAANFGRGGQSGILQFGAAGQGNATSGFGIANAALGTGMQAGNSVMQGYQTALSGYNNIMDNYTRMGSADIQANAGASAAGMQGLGQMAGMAMQFIPGFGLSDARTKENIRPLTKMPSGIQLYRFEFKKEFRDANGHGTFVGPLAHEVQEIAPELVMVGDDGFLRVDYSRLR